MFIKKRTMIAKKKPVKERSPRLYDFEIPEIGTNNKRNSAYQQKRFVSPIYGNNVKDNIVLPPQNTLGGNTKKRYSGLKPLDERRMETDYNEFNIVNQKKEKSSFEEITQQEEMFSYDEQYQVKDQMSSQPVKSKIVFQHPTEESETDFELEDEFSIESKEEIKQFFGEERTQSNNVESKNKVNMYQQTSIEEKQMKARVFMEKSSFEENYVDYSNYRLPPITIFPKSFKQTDSDESWIDNNIEIINECLRVYRVDGHVTTYTKGPTVTRYEVMLNIGVKTNKIVSIEKELQMNLAVQTLRIEAPIPGKNTVGIEVPNTKREMIQFGDIVNNNKFKEDYNPLKVALGIDIDGKEIYTDIGKMPHGLVAGATGSGKSVCINTILISLLLKNKPDQLKLILVDPKRVELADYAGLPHLAAPVITDVKYVPATMNWAVEEMERRFLLFESKRLRNIQSYNNRVGKDEKLPFIVIVIDELADLMMQYGSEIESYIMRLTQKARAAGIHLIIATQRPSTDVIKGTIKANIPSRIAFSVRSYVDSMTILDSPGAEKLLGKGDMLFGENGQPERRIQGAFVNDDLIVKVTDYIKRQCGANYLFDPETLAQKADSSSSNQSKSRRTEIPKNIVYEIAVFCVKNKAASINRITRNFSMSYNKVSELMEEFEKLGIVSQNKGTKAREVLVDLKELNDIFND